MIKIPQGVYDRIEKAAKEGFPEEVCGLLAGKKTENIKVVEDVYVIENIDHSKEHFSMAPKDQFAAIKDIRARGLEPLGNFHSHPESPARPSKEDKRLAYDSEASYLIISLMEEKAVLKAFSIVGGESSEENIEYIPSGGSF